jgi:hypothetical protein
MSGRASNGNGSERRDLADAVAVRRRATMVGSLRALRGGGRPSPSGFPVPPGAERQGASVVGATSGPASEEFAERCDLCGVGVPEDHRHLLHLVQRRIVCACEACWAMRAGEGEYRPTASRTVWLPDLDIPDELWASFQIPIGLAFLMHSTSTGCVVAMYPSPAGATESELHFESWQEMVTRNPMLAGLEPDIEGLIVNRLIEPHIHVIAPIDQCYALTGAVKATWEGISGGTGVERAVTRFFDELRKRATVG